MPHHNPYLNECRLHWRNRLDEWWEAPGESLFYLIAGAIFCTILLWPLLVFQSRNGAALLDGLEARLPWFALALAAMGYAATRRWISMRRCEWQSGWWGAQPIAESIGWQALRWQLAWRISCAIAVTEGLLISTAWRAAIPVSPVLMFSAAISLLAGSAAGGWRVHSAGGRTSVSRRLSVVSAFP